MASTGSRSPWLERIAGCAAGIALIAGAVGARGAVSLPEGPGAKLVYANCQTCHGLENVVESKGLLPAQWRAVLQTMKDYGCPLAAPAEQEILQYLVTYLGSAPPPQASRAPEASTLSGGPAKADGAAVYASNCTSCHGVDGRGRPGSFPPLAGNPDLAKNAQFPVLVLLHGLSGPIEVNGARFDGAMPPFDHLSDAEIAAVVNHLRAAGRDAAPAESVTPEQVAELRKRDVAPAQVRAARLP